LSIDEILYENARDKLWQKQSFYYVQKFNVLVGKSVIVGIWALVMICIYVMFFRFFATNIWEFTFVTITISSTPATCAGITFIRTVEGYAALPPGTYTPAYSTGDTLCPRIIPVSSVVIQVFLFCFAWKSLIFLMARLITSRSSLSISLYASSISASVSLIFSSFISALSNFFVYSKTASSPRRWTSFTIWSRKSYRVVGGCIVFVL
jgi:hypothetical protein